MEAVSLAGCSESGTLIRGQHLRVMAAGSERVSGITRRRASGALNQLNATISRGIKTPERERRLERRSGTSDWSGFGKGPVDMEKVGREH